MHSGLVGAFAGGNDHEGVVTADAPMPAELDVGIADKADNEKEEESEASAEQEEEERETGVTDEDLMPNGKQALAQLATFSPL